VGDSAKVFTRRLASGWTIAGQVSGVSSSHGQLKQVMISEHFKKRQNAHILTKKRQNFRKSDKKRQSDKCKKNASNNNEKATKNDPFVGKRQKRQPCICVLQIAGISIQLDPIAKINEAAFFTFPYCCNYYIAVDICYEAENYTRLRNRGNYMTTCRTLKGRHIFFCYKLVRKNMAAFLFCT